MLPGICTRARSHLRKHKSHKDLRAADVHVLHKRENKHVELLLQRLLDRIRPTLHKQRHCLQLRMGSLRLHPPLDTGRSPLVDPSGQGPVMMPPLRSFRDIQASAPGRGALEIYDGFDFGFSPNGGSRAASASATPTPISHQPQSNRSSGNKNSIVSPRPMMRLMPSRPHSLSDSDGEGLYDDVDYDDRKLSAPPSSWYSPGLSSSSSSSSSSSGGSSSAEWEHSDPPPPPADRRTMRRPQQPVVTPRHQGGFNTLAADYFITRGGWKRRGIVFASDEPTAPSEEECFEIP